MPWFTYVRVWLIPVYAGKQNHLLLVSLGLWKTLENVLKSVRVL